MPSFALFCGGFVRQAGHSIHPCLTAFSQSKRYMSPIWYWYLCEEPVCENRFQCFHSLNEFSNLPRWPNYLKPLTSQTRQSQLRGCIKMYQVGGLEECTCKGTFLPKGCRGHWYLLKITRNNAGASCKCCKWIWCLDNTSNTMSRKRELTATCLFEQSVKFPTGSFLFTAQANPTANRSENGVGVLGKRDRMRTGPSISKSSARQCDGTDGFMSLSSRKIWLLHRLLWFCNMCCATGFVGDKQHIYINMPMPVTWGVWPWWHPPYTHRYVHKHQDVCRWCT